MKVTFYGAAGQVTGSMHLIEAAGAKILLDAGLFQGRRNESRQLNTALPVDPRMLDAIILSHAHIDHSGRLPLLVRHGFHSPIYATPATRDLCGVMLPDAANIQEKDAEFLQRRGVAGPASEPLYSLPDAIAVQDLMMGVPYGRVQYIRKHLAFEFTDAGHILGSASVMLRTTEGKGHRLIFSGDIGRPGLPIIRDPDPPSEPADTLIVESTYANRMHDAVADGEERLGDLIRKVAARGGKVMIPAFALGRVQELVYSLHQLFRAGKIPGIPIFVDSPLAIDATAVFRMHPDLFDRSERMIERTTRLFDFPLLVYTRSVEDSKGLNGLNGPAIIIAASGMAESGRILHHLSNGLTDHRNLVLFVGYQAEHTLGRRIQDGARQVKVLGRDVDIRCEVESISGYSAHADKNELKAWIRKLGEPPRRAFVVHGEPDALNAMAKMLKEEGVRRVDIPKQGESFDLEG